MRIVNVNGGHLFANFFSCEQNISPLTTKRAGNESSTSIDLPKNIFLFGDWNLKEIQSYKYSLREIGARTGGQSVHVATNRTFVMNTHPQNTLKIIHMHLIVSFSVYLVRFVSMPVHNKSKCGSLGNFIW